MEPERIEPFAWRVPVGAVPDMRVPGIVYASEDLMSGTVGSDALLQVANVATLPGIVRASYAMPDVHWGYGFPIGGVAATDASEGVISPGGVGFDIACGVRLLRSNLEWESEVKPVIAELVAALGRETPRGVGTGGRLRLARGEVEKVLLEGVPFLLSQGVGLGEEDAEFCEDGGILPNARPEHVSERAVARGSPQLGSLGAGNHFLEVQVVEEIADSRAATVMGLFQGQVCVMIHTGSRGLGHQACTDHLKVMDRLMPQLGIRVPDRQLACVPFSHPAAGRYVGAMQAAGNFARANRHILGDGARAAFESVFSRSARALGLFLVYDVAHNLARFEEHQLDGRTARLCVHRKGATPALGPGHPGLPAAYREIGQPVLIPGSMGTSSYVLVGTVESAQRSFSSTCHGAGRAMSRTKARKVMSGTDLAEQLRTRGITLAPAHWRLLSEEAPYAYKDVEQVVRACEGAGLSRTVARLRPVGVVKG